MRPFASAIAMGALLVAGPPSFAMAGPTITVGVASGADNNVFLSETDTQRSLFLQTTLRASVETDGTQAQRLSWTLRGLSKHYLQYGEADKLFGDSVAAYRYALHRSMLLGLIQSASYTQVQLLDTEGNTLPRERFVAYAHELRGYIQALPTLGTHATFGGGIRYKDIKETADSPALSFPSLDHRGYFVTAEAGYRRGSRRADLSYEYAVTQYDETQANNQWTNRQGTSLTGTRLATNPQLDLVQHTVRANLGRSWTRWIAASIEGQGRWNIDPFEGDLTYRQWDGKTQVDLTLAGLARWSNVASYRTRIYAERTASADSADRRERFIHATTMLVRSWTPHFSSSLQYQLSRKTSNVAGDRFTARAALIGMEVSY
jgi:hypothetical protein